MSVACDGQPFSKENLSKDEESDDDCLDFGSDSGPEPDQEAAGGDCRSVFDKYLEGVIIDPAEAFKLSHKNPS